EGTADGGNNLECQGEEEFSVAGEAGCSFEGMSELCKNVEEILEQCRNDSRFIQFPPSILVVSALLLICNGIYGGGVTREDVLDTCTEVGLTSMDCLSKCLELLGTALSEQSLLTSVPASTAARDATTAIKC
ncbi:unnamed protein product, partial [Discosporangium mesarthrocarpum]